MLSGRTGSLHLYHTTAWARRVSEVVQDRPVYLSVSDGNGPLLRMIAFEEAPRPGYGAGWRRMVSVARNRLGPRWLRWYGQPVMTNDVSREAYAFLGQSIAAHARTVGRRLIAGEWPLDMKDQVPDEWTTRRWATLKVDLARPIEAIRAGVRQSARKEIRKAIDRGVVVRRIENLEELRRYVAEAQVCAKRYGNTGVRVDDFESMWRNLRGNGCYFETFGAWLGDSFMAGLSVWGTRHSVGELGSFQSKRAYDEKISGPDLVKWTALEWAQAEGISTFDLAGVSPNPSTEKEQNIRRFKEKWGGVLEEHLVLSDRPRALPRSDA